MPILEIKHNLTDTRSSFHFTTSITGIKHTNTWKTKTVLSPVFVELIF